MEFKVKPLPPDVNLETTAILKQLVLARSSLAELKGASHTIPNENILISTLTLQEAKDSSAIENIITTQDEIYKARLFENFITNAAAKEVNLYADALAKSYYMIKNENMITTETILTIQKILIRNNAGFRKIPGTKLINNNTNETVFIPPQNNNDILILMDNLISFVNDDSLCSADPLIKMALMHYQFETIHPFYDGNGRTGRILNILYLVLKDLLNLPILYLSRYIINSKDKYYKLLQDVRDNENWESWIIYILKGIEITSKETISLIKKIKGLMQDYKQRIRNDLPKIYSQDLLNNIFKHPYTKIDLLATDLKVSRQTATRYLDNLVDKEFLEKVKLKTSNFYVNAPLFNLFKDIKVNHSEKQIIKTINP